MERVEKMLKGKIPPEIFDFLNREAGRSLLIRGPAGTGKTTLALEIMEKMRHLMNTYYLTSRVADSALYDHFTWLKQMVEEGEMMKVVREMEKLTLKKEAAERKGPRVERTELRKLEGFIEDGGEPLFEHGEITLSVSSPVEELDLVYDVVEKALPKSTLVVIDSVEGICEKYGISPAKLIYVLEKDLVENAHTKILFVVETPEAMLDYLADGVVSLEMRIVNNRTLRTMEIRKLRGMRVSRSHYLYTLEGGRFTALPPPEPEDVNLFNTFEGHGKNPFVTEIERVDKIIGDLGTKGVILNLFTDEGLTVADQYLFLKKIIAWHLLSGKGVFCMPPRVINVKDCLKYFSSSKECTERFRTHLRFLQLHTYVQMVSERLENQMLLEGTDLNRELSQEVLKAGIGIEPPYLFVIDAEALFYTYRNIGAVEIMNFIKVIRETGSNCIFVTYRGATFETISQLSDINLVLKKLESVPLIAGEFPHTPFYGFSIEKYVSSPKCGSKPAPREIKVRVIPIV
ncbi:MAG: gas vesicle protein GvpD P-loop domain-containing protein [Thermoplasmata archaeon]